MDSLLNILQNYYINLKTFPRYNLSSSDDKLLLHHPNIRTLATLGDHSFTALAPKLWNDLPVVIHQAINFAAFKRFLKTHLFKKAYSCW